MKFSSNPRHLRRLPRFISGSIALLILFTTGCASPRNPRPPSLNLPETVSDLAVQRIGNQVQLQWTTPSRTTDGLDIKGPMTAEFCRQAGSSSSCTPVLRLPASPGTTQTVDPLPPWLTVDPASLLTYRVQIFNSASRSAGISNPAFAPSGTAPPAVAQLHATATREGALIEWQPPTSLDRMPQASSQVELDRTLIAPTATKKTAKPSSGQQFPSQFTPSPPAQVHLQAGNSRSDPGGTLDRTAIKGESYSYTAQRVRSVDLNGRTFQLRSFISPPVTLHLTDIFPPQPPLGLVTIPGDTSIDLSWEAGIESDLAGYIVYRQELTRDGEPQGSVVRLTQTPVTGPAFSDRSANPGHRYAYRVTAVDTAGNQSSPSTAVQETMREQ